MKKELILPESNLKHAYMKHLVFVWSGFEKFFFSAVNYRSWQDVFFFSAMHSFIFCITEIMGYM